MIDSGYLTSTVRSPEQFRTPGHGAKLVFLLLIAGVLVCSTQTRLPSFAFHGRSAQVSVSSAQQAHQRFPEPQKKFWDGLLAPAIVLAILMSPPPVSPRLRSLEQTEQPVDEQFPPAFRFRPPPFA